MAEREPFPWETEGETLALETPEQTVIELTLAPFGSRLVAALIDQAILYGILVGIILLAILVASIVGINVLSEEWLLDAAGVLKAVMLIVWFLVSTLAPAWWEIRSQGRTPGKRRLKLRTVMAQGQALTNSAAVLRNLARLVDQFPLLWLIPALGPGKRRIGDYLAGTLVVSEVTPSEKRRRYDWLSVAETGLPDRHYFFGSEVKAKLKPEDLDLIEYLGDRLPSLKSAKRRELLLECAQRYIERLGLQADAARITEEPERFLRELGLFLRESYRERAF